MGLRTTHDCFHGPYSSFNAWRAELHAAITGDSADKESLKAAWLRGEYEDQSKPINVLMNHSDCDGVIKHRDCLPLSYALCELLPKLPESTPTLSDAAITRQFIQGLWKAHQLGQDVEFK